MPDKNHKAHLKLTRQMVFLHLQFLLANGDENNFIKKIYLIIPTISVVT